MMWKSFQFGCAVVSCMVLFQAGCQEPSRTAQEPSVTPTEPKELPQETTDTPSTGKLSPRITFEKVLHDFGEVAPNSSNTGQFKFTNTGKAPLRITEVGRCCGVVATLEDNKKEYAPGESGAVKVEWRSGSVPSVFRRQLIVHSNDPSSPATTLNIEAKTVLKVVCNPTRFNLSLDEQNAGCPEITVNSVDNQPFSISEFKATGDCMTADLDPSVQATTHTIRPKVNVERLQNNLKGQIQIKTTHPQGGVTTISFDVVPEYTITPPLIVVFNAESGKSMTKKLTVLNNYDRDFEIESVSSANNVVAIKVLARTKIPNGYQLDVEMTIPALDGQIKFADEFLLNLNSGKKLSVGCSGYYSTSTAKSETR